jgi:hypothetical protein
MRCASCESTRLERKGEEFSQPRPRATRPDNWLTWTIRRPSAAFRHNPRHCPSKCAGREWKGKDDA